MEERNIIVKYLDSLPQIFFWELDEFLVVFFLAGIGIFLEKLTLMLGIGIAVAYILSKFKATKIEGFFIHFLYWHGIPIINSKRLPDSFIKKYLGF